MVYHLLGEPFSAYTGLALANSVANTMRFDESSVVVCPEADDTWGFKEDRILVIPQLNILTVMIRGASMRGWRFVPSSTRKQIICSIFGSVLSTLKSGDIVWCYNWPYVAQALQSVIQSKGAKLIYHAHNSLAPYAARTLFKSFTPDALIFNSEAMRQEALRLMPYLKNTHTVHNGADEALFYPLPADAARNNTPPVILYVGRLVPQKGVHVLIEAMRILQKRNIQASCKLVGSSHAGGRRSKVTTYIKSLHKRRSPNVQFEQFRAATDIAEEYRAADIFCCPSIWQEPFGNVNIEAMASGVPVVASRVGGIPEIAAEGGVLLVEPDSAVGLADALQRLILDKDLRAKIGAEGLASFRRRFTWTVINRQHNHIIRSLESHQAEIELTR
jgi:spore coat protein SA